MGAAVGVGTGVAVGTSVAVRAGVAVGAGVAVEAGVAVGAGVIVGTSAVREDGGVEVSVSSGIAVAAGKGASVASAPQATVSTANSASSRPTAGSLPGLTLCILYLICSRDRFPPGVYGKKRRSALVRGDRPKPRTAKGITSDWFQGRTRPATSSCPLNPAHPSHVGAFQGYGADYALLLKGVEGVV